MRTTVKETTSFTVWLHRLFDATVPLFTLLIVSQLYNTVWTDRYQVLGMLGGLLLVISNQGLGVYSHWRGRTLFAGFKLVFQAWMFTWLVLLAFAFLLKDSAYYSRVIVTSWAFLTPLVLLIYRFLLRYYMGYFRSRGWHSVRVAILGAGDLGQRLAEIFNQAKMLGYQPVAYYDDDIEKQNEIINGIPVLGTIQDFIDRDNYSSDFDEVYLALPLRAEKQIVKTLNGLADSTVTVKFIPDCFAFDLLHSRMSDIGGIPIISVYDSPLNTLTQRFFKQAEDFFLSLIILVLISPVMLLIAIIIKLTSSGPVLFKQIRYGLNGKEIIVWKFRTMTVADNGDDVPQATKNDTRITPFGSFLRQTSLDELPQFFNTLTGSMSIVGPRPHAKAHNEQYRKLIPRYMLRHKVKPGITGWAQINGFRGETETTEKMEKRVQYDLYYIDNWSVWLDVKIILLTIIKGFINKNAY